MNKLLDLLRDLQFIQNSFEVTDFSEIDSEDIEYINNILIKLINKVEDLLDKYLD